jgi:hypothetical protein
MSQRQKYDNDCQEKFDCDERTRRFDLIRRPRLRGSLLALSEPLETGVADAKNCVSAAS